MKVKKLKLELIHIFIPLAVIFIFLSFILPKNPLMQLQLLILFGLLYFMTVFVHHNFDKSLTFEIMAEYILVAILAIVIILGGIFI
jgi:hypothetical protein